MFNTLNLSIMSTKLNHTTALQFVFKNVSEKELNSLVQAEPSQKTKDLAAQLRKSQIADYNQARTEILGTTFRKLAHILAAQKKVDETALLSEMLPNDKVTSLTDTADRLATYIMTAVNKRIDAQLDTTPKKTNVNVTLLKKMYKTFGANTTALKGCAEYFNITEDQATQLLK